MSKYFLATCTAGVMLLCLTGCLGSGESIALITPPSLPSYQANLPVHLGDTSTVTPSLPSYQANLPVHPGDASTATLEGIDTNNNKVRDEVEITIATLAKDADNFNQAMISAALFQTILTTKLTTQVEAQAKVKEFYCREQARSDASKNEIPVDLLRTLIYDTPARWAEYSRYQQLVGVTLTFVGDITCN